MVQAVRSGKAEHRRGEHGLGTSKKTVLGLVDVVRVSLEELLPEYVTWGTGLRNVVSFQDHLSNRKCWGAL